jgi:hypothetical protein
MLSSSAKIVRAAPVQMSLSTTAQPRVLSASVESSLLQRTHQHQLRWKHSQTQIKRIFLQHPARQRVEERLGVDRTPAPLDPPKFGAVFQPVMLPNGWSAPPGPDVTIPEYPFQIKRTKNKPNDAAGFLPVYTKFRYVKNAYYSCARLLSCSLPQSQTCI